MFQMCFEWFSSDFSQKFAKLLFCAIDLSLRDMMKQMVVDERNKTIANVSLLAVNCNMTSGSLLEPLALSFMTVVSQIVLAKDIVRKFAARLQRNTPLEQLSFKVRLQRNALLEQL